MMKHLLLAALLVLTGLMLVTSPVTAMGAAAQSHCAQEMQQVSDHHGHGTHHAMDAAPDESAIQQTYGSCCDHCTLVDALVGPQIQPRDARISRVFSRWTVDDLADLTIPYGLRRPPRG